MRCQFEAQAASRAKSLSRERHSDQLRQEKQPGPGMPEQIEDIDRFGERAGTQHFEFFPEVRLRKEGRQTQGETRQNHKNKWDLVEKVWNIHKYLYKANGTRLRM